jgi:hypothetical protein
MRVTDNGNGRVTDNVTGLMWQKCSAGQTNDASCTGTPTGYSWYEATGTADATYNPGGATDVCGSLNLGGQTDWRLPTKKELMSIVNYGTYGPAIDGTYFPNTAAASGYWSSTTSAGDASLAWGVGFGNGYGGGGGKTNGLHVRCVRGSEAPAPDFANNGNGTVTDNVTGLVWEQCSAGQSGADCGAGAAGTYTWQGALDYCNGLSLAGSSGWRLPNVKELESITDDSRYSPAIDGTYFPNTAASGCWSSTTYASSASDAWYVSFGDGYVYGYSKPYYRHVRCVR